MGVKILSLFDGMACGMIAMLRAGVPVESYDAYEIDKYAIKTAQHNFPDIKEHGDVFDADFTQYEGVDFLIGGSPCTYWSIAQTKNRETVASGMGWELFSQYVRALKEAKPKYFIYENNKSMSKQIRASIDDAFGFEAVLINSALVSAQNRQRLYWVGRRNADGTYSKVNVEQPADRGILLKDVLDNAVAMREKAHAVIASAGRTTEREFFMKNQGNMAAEPVRGMENDTKSRTLTANYWKTNVRDAFVDCAGGRTMAAEPVSYCTDKNMEHLMRNFGSKGKIVDEESKTPTLMAAAGMGGGNHIYYANSIAEPINDICQFGAMPRPDGEISISAGFRIYSTEAKGRYVCANGGGAGAKTGLYAVPLDGFIPGERTVGSQMEFLGGINGRHEKWLEDGKNYSRNFSQGHRLYGVNGKAVTQTAQACGYAGNTGLYAIPTMPVKEATEKGYTEIECGDCVDLSMPNSKTRRGRSMADKANCMQTSNDFYQYVAYAIEFDDDGRPIKAIGKDGKEITIYEVKDGKITIKGKQYPIKLKDGYYIIRKLTVSECKRLQTVPEWYEFPVSDSQAYKMLGNGWTCEVISHILKYLKEA